MGRVLEASFYYHFQSLKPTMNPEQQKTLRPALLLSVNVSDDSTRANGRSQHKSTKHGCIVY
jgi:hypothetical protein